MPDPRAPRAVADLMSQLLLRGWIRATGEDAERGDVPGWVLVTIMTAGLVTVLWALAGDKLGTIFGNALDKVTGPGG